MSKPAKDWVSAFPEDDEIPQRKPPPARPRTRPVPQDTVPKEELRTAKPSVKNPPDPGSIVPNKPAEERSPEAAYDVGYKKPPIHGRFKPGQSGNPKGRPKGAKGLNTIVREYLGAKVPVRTPNGVKKISKIEAVFQKTIEKAFSGDQRAQRELMKLWNHAVPEAQPEENASKGEAESLTASDLATLEAFLADHAAKGDRSCK